MLVALGLAFAALQGAPLPALSGRVVDTANLLAPDERSRLESRLEAIETETSVQIVLATIPSLGGEAIEDYAVRLFEHWRLGQAGLDNGVLVLVVPAGRRVRIEVGYGLEPVIPDGMAGRILRERIAPAFREERYFDGLSAAVDGLALAARREYPEAPMTPRPQPGIGIGAIFFVYFVLGVLGNAMGVVLAMIAGAFLFPLLGGGFAAALGGWAYALGALLGLLAVLMVRGSGRRGSWTTGGHSSGYRGGFGGFGSGGFSGGGFSGGGGRSGGGGASGSW